MQTCHLAYDESIFVDDNKANAQAAYNLGITGILYKNPKSFTRALGACGIEVDKCKPTVRTKGCRFWFVWLPPLGEGFGHQLLQICSLIWLSAAFSRRLTWAWLMPISFATCVCVLPFR